MELNFNQYRNIIAIYREIMYKTAFPKIDNMDSK